MEISVCSEERGAQRSASSLYVQENQHVVPNTANQETAVTHVS